MCAMKQNSCGPSLSTTHPMADALAKGVQAFVAVLMPLTGHSLPFASTTAVAYQNRGVSAAGVDVAGTVDAGIVHDSISGARRSADKSSTTPLCAGCHRVLTAADLQASVAPPPSGSGSEPLLECTACHRCFHSRCHRQWAAAEEQRQTSRRCQRQQQARSWWPWRRWQQRLPVEDDTGAAACRRACGAAGAAAAAGRAAAGGAVRGGDAAGKMGVEEGGEWFHSADCWQVHRVLQRACRRGAVPCRHTPAASHASTHIKPSGDAALIAATTVAFPNTSCGGAATPCDSNTQSSDAAKGPDPTDSGQTAVPRTHLAIRLYDCRDRGPAASAGLWQVHSVLRQHFGYAAADYRQFDYAALLTRDRSAMSAAVIDVYGSDLAELYLVATRTAAQRQGYGKALVRHLEQQLCSAGVRRLLVSVDDDDYENQGMWCNKFGFQPLTEPELEALGMTFGAFSPTSIKGTVFFARMLGGEKTQKLAGNKCSQQERESSYMLPRADVF